MSSKHTVLILGAGMVGRAAAKYAAESPLVQGIIVADRDPLAATRALAAAGGHGDAVRIDVSENEALTALIARADAVLNCVGPFYRYGTPVLAAAIAAGRSYLDICDDWEPTLAMLEQGGAARSAGVTAIIGQGASPGTTNLLAVAALDALKAPTSVLTGWSLEDSPGTEVNAAHEHWLHQCTGLIRVLRAGQMTDEAPLHEVEVHFPSLPARPALTVGHPEAVTLPNVYPALNQCLNLMTLPRSLANTLQKAAASVESGESITDATRHMIASHRPGSTAEWAVYPGLWAIAEGPDGRVGARLTDDGGTTDLAAITAGPLIAGLELVLSGQTQGPGVFSPEQSLPTAPYFAALARVMGVKGPLLELIREGADPLPGYGK